MPLPPQREPLRLMDRLNRQVNIQIRPIEVVRLRALDIENFGDLSIFELGVLEARKTRKSASSSRQEYPRYRLPK